MWKGSGQRGAGKVRQEKGVSSHRTQRPSVLHFRIQRRKECCLERRQWASKAEAIKVRQD